MTDDKNKNATGHRFANLIDRHGTPKAMAEFDEFNNQRFNYLMDCGSWHGLLLPAQNDNILGFTGPAIIAEEYTVALSEALEQLSITINHKDGTLQTIQPEKTLSRSLPGQLQLRYEDKSLAINLELCFLSGRSALIKTHIHNLTDQTLSLRLIWKGRFLEQWSEDNSVSTRYPEWKRRWQSNTQDGSLKASFGRLRADGDMFFSGDSVYRIERDIRTEDTIDDDGLGYRSEYHCQISHHGYKTLHTLQSFCFDKTEIEREAERSYEWLMAPAKTQKDAHQRWHNLIDRALIKKNTSNAIERLAIKSVETLIGNWRSPAGAIQHAGFAPSNTFRWFNGLWPWDSWKMIRAMAPLAPALAAEGMRAIFDYQIKPDDPVRPLDAGMLIDTVFFNQDAARGGDGSNWNERNSKPSLASWAFEAVYEEMKKQSPAQAHRLLEEFFPKLLAYHQWWYRNRTFNNSSMVSYGATQHPLHINEGEMNAQAVQIACSWESGMDNAARFGFIEPDALATYARENQLNESEAGKLWSPEMLSVIDNGNTSGFVIDQHSIDINAYLCQEKQILSRLASLLGHHDDAEQLKKEAIDLREILEKQFYDQDSGFFYDKGTNQQKQLLTHRGRGPEGWTPLFCQLANTEQAASIRDRLMDKAEFNTPVPCPTASRSNPSYDPEAYWRGRVWLDQLHFALVGLANYGYDHEAKTLAAQLLLKGEGILDNKPLRENYNPETGAMMGATNFGWSAAHLYMMYREGFFDGL
ncbi:MGH1-like glycoside hydrolase domain-containing protein [Parendozoicomonas haliclonae]|uniref:Glucosidase YgjK n=1 Tax=Parendozoicomonas haliclonae TaxID=1960125 RepID=A0A1X7AKR7_9GAMM|nr:trehalase family glycosidase [Parendozoicomonas haliclonae]SMA44265.1 Glucosidase YgjK precursor [Parendozoicomonas haliclonae]